MSSKLYWIPSHGMQVQKTMLEHVTVRLAWTHVDTDAIEFVLRLLIAVSWLKRRLKVKEAVVTRDDMTLRALEEALWEVPLIDFGEKEINPDFMFTADELFENFGKAQSLADSELERLWDLWRRRKQDKSRESVRSHCRDMWRVRLDPDTLQGPFQFYNFMDDAGWRHAARAARPLF